MNNHSQPFDLGELSRQIDQRRKECGLSMAALGREVGVAASTIRRFETADDAEADGVLALIAWLDVAPERFMPGSSVERTPLPQPGEGQIRVDMKRVGDATSTRVTAQRTTIQRLAAAAQTSGRTIESLTRWSEI